MSNRYLDKIEAPVVFLEDGKLIANRFPPLIGIDPDLLVNSDPAAIQITISFTFSNGAATYLVIASEGGLLIAERIAQSGEVADV